MLKKLKALIIVIFFLAYFFTSDVNVFAKDEKLRKLQELSQILIESVKAKDYEKSKLVVENISETFPSIQYKGLTTVEGIAAITSAIIQTKQSLAALEPNDKVIFHYSTQLYLAIDALVHKGQPLWHRYYSLIEKDLGEIGKAIKSQDTNRVQVAIQTLQMHYHLIKPAILVSTPPHMVEKIDSLLTALVSQTVEQNKEIILNQLNETIHQLFYGNDQVTLGKVMTGSILWKTSIGMGLIIFFALSYVIWRKFQGTYQKNKITT